MINLGFLNIEPLWAQKNGVTISGKVTNSVSRKAIDFGTVIILEAKKKTFTAEDGSYRITVPEKGEYTLIIQSSGLRQLKTKVSLQKNQVRNFALQPIRVRGQAIVVRGKRDLQKVSRHTMTVRELKAVPATFGDTINALTSLPGVIRMGNDLFGPMVIRGGNYLGVNFFIDDIPIYEPLHYGGLHSVINSNLISEIDLYSSAFPARFGNASSAVININTTDSVERFSGFIEMAAISSAALIQTPILRRPDGSVLFGYPTLEESEEYENAGYIIAAGRRGYIDLIALPIIELITGDSISIVPIYWDYQFKMKYYFNSRHSLTVLAIGSSDYMKFVNDEDTQSTFGANTDPLLDGLTFRTDKQSHSQGLYYTYEPSNRLYNRLIFTSALMNNYTYLNAPGSGVNDALKNYSVDSLPYIFGVKDRFFWDIWEDHLELLIGVNANLYYFRANGKTIGIRKYGAAFNISDPALLTEIYLNEEIINYIVGGYAELKFEYGWFTFSPGIRSEYLYRTGEVIADPRFLFSIEFPTETTLSLAGGQYSYFFQVNPFLFDGNPQVSAIGDELEPEVAIHRVIGIEQIFLEDYRIKIEGFYNTFRNLALLYYHYEPDGMPLEGLTTGRINAYGFEAMLKKDLQENEDGLFGWISYTYTRSQFKSGLPVVDGLYGNSENLADPYGNTWLNYQWEQRHNLKLVAGYVFGMFTLSAKFQLYSSFGYTPIVGAERDPIYPGPGDRYIPEYGRPYSRHFPMNHRLDIRFSYKREYSWGYISFYVEFINIYNQRSITQEDYNYGLPYVAGINPSHDTEDEGLGLIPNFGVELKF